MTQRRTFLPLSFFAGAVLFPIALRLFGGEATVVILAPAMFAPVTVVLIAIFAFAANHMHNKVLGNFLSAMATALAGALLVSAGLLLFLAVRR